MKKATPFIETEPVETASDILTEVLRSGAQRMLAAALQDEVACYLAQHEAARDESGRRLVVRNGHCPERTIQTGLGSMKVRRPPSTTAVSTRTAVASSSPARSCLRTCGGRSPSRS